VDVTASSKILLTSDRPVTIYSLRAPDGQLFLPISPTKLFIAANEQKVMDDLEKAAPLTIVKESNELVVSRARRYVLSRDQWQQDYIKKHISTKLEPTPLMSNLDRPPEVDVADQKSDSARTVA
jgi:hypothetical protein